MQHSGSVQASVTRFANSGGKTAPVQPAEKPSGLQNMATSACSPSTITKAANPAHQPAQNMPAPGAWQAAHD